MFLKISQNSQENTCAGVYFFKQICKPSACTLFNTRLQHRWFLTKHLRPTLPTPKFWPTPLTSFFDPRHTHQNFNPRHARHPRQNFMDPRFPSHPRQKFDTATHAPTLTTPPISRLVANRGKMFGIFQILFPSIDGRYKYIYLVKRWFWNRCVLIIRIYSVVHFFFKYKSDIFANLYFQYFFYWIKIKWNLKNDHNIYLINSQRKLMYNILEFTL